MNSQHLRLKWHFEKLDKYGPRSLKLQRLKSQTKEIFFIKVKTCPRPPKMAHLNIFPHVYVTVWEDLHNTAQMYTNVYMYIKERWCDSYSRCSIVAAAGTMS